MQSNKDNINLPQNLAEKMLSAQETYEVILDSISLDKPFMAARFGGSESKVIHSLAIKREREVPKEFRDEIKIKSGVTPPIGRVLKYFSYESISAALKSDLMGLWKFKDEDSNKRQISLLSVASPKSLTDLDYLNPFIVRHMYGIEPWTRQLSGMKVLIVHPFKDSISQQIGNIGNISTIKEIWPKDISFTILPPPVTFAGENTDSNWIDELSRLKERIYKTDFDICFVAAGAYGLPIAGFVKDLGKMSIHLGGSLQLLFGITGSRWEEQGYYDLSKQQGWIRPHVNEKPKLHQRIDASSYW